MADQTVTDAERRLDVLEAAVAALGRDLAILRSGREARDGQDRALRHALATITRGLAFTVRDLLAHSAEDPRLRRALVDATLQSPGEIGAWLRDHQGTVDGVAILRLPRRKWRAVHVEQVRASGR